MPQISKQFVKHKVKQKIEWLLKEVISRSRDQEDTAELVEALLTKTEQVMISKRLSIVLMLVKGCRIPEIEETLKVSRPTVYQSKRIIDNSGEKFQKMIKVIIQEDKMRERQNRQVAEEAESNWIIPPKGNWKAIKSGQWQKVKDTEVPF